MHEHELPEDPSTATYRSVEAAMRATPYVALGVIAVSAFLFLAGASAVRFAPEEVAAAAHGDAGLSAQLRASERVKQAGLK